MIDFDDLNLTISLIFIAILIFIRNPTLCSVELSMKNVLYPQDQLLSVFCRTRLWTY